MSDKFVDVDSEPVFLTKEEVGYDPEHKIDWHEVSRIALIRGFLEAKEWMAINEYTNARTVFNIQANEYTSGRLQWAKHKLATIRLLRKDAINPYKTIDRYRRFIEKQGELQCQKESQGMQPDSKNRCG